MYMSNTKEMETLKEKLLSGEEVLFNNESWCEQNVSDDFRQASLSFTDHGPTWSHGFKLWFNGQLLHAPKTFKSLENRLSKLSEKWNLELAENE